LNKDSNHVVAVKDIKNGVVTYVANIKSADGEMLTGQISVKDLENGVYITEDGLLKAVDGGDVAPFKFNGQALVSPEDSMSDGISDIAIVKNVFGLDDIEMANMDRETVKLLGNIIKAVSNPDTSSKEVTAVWNLADKNVDGLAQLIGLDNFKNATKEDIVKYTVQRMMDISQQQSAKETLMAVELAAVAGGLLYAMKDQNVNTIAQLSKVTPKNQATMTKLLRKEYDKSVSDRGANDFVINISQLQKTVATKIQFSKEEREKILDVLNGLIDDTDKTKERIFTIMKLSDIHAVAASA
jgi:hypothetical protein